MNAPVKLKSPYPWFGGKSAVADEVWQYLGDVRNYVEPFFGSGAVLLSRPADNTRIETINDADGFVANFWRATQFDPEAVAYWADWPVSEIDLYARHGFLINRKERLLWSLEDPDFYDPKIAGWRVWGISCWIGGGFCSGNGPWISNGAHIHDSRELAAQKAKGISRRRPHLSNAGQGISRKELAIKEYICALSDRMRNVRVCCGDWSRITGPSVTIKNGMTGVFLDPPYAAETGRSMGLYAEESGSVSHDVRKWCIENGNNPLLRIILCGYKGEHDMPDTWRCIESRATGGVRGGYGAQRKDGSNENGARERLWLSPHCLDHFQQALI